MSLETFYTYMDCIPMLEAQEILNKFTISDWPNLKKEDRSRLHKKLFKQAYPKEFNQEKRATLADVAKALSGRR